MGTDSAAVSGPTTGPRALQRDEWDNWYDTLVRAFGGVPEPDEERELFNSLTEVDRSIGVWDGGACVGTAGAFSFRMTVPGGAEVPAAGVTMVSVAATHRRRGVLTSMMRRQLDDVRSWGEPLAVLTASEPAIYGRFGYGAATFQVNAEIDTTRVRLSVPEGTDGVRLRYAVPAEVLDACEEVYARSVPGGRGCWPGGPAGSNWGCWTRRAAGTGRRRCSAWSRRGTTGGSRGTRGSGYARPGGRRAPTARCCWPTWRRWTR
ncbi:N-acetyltransferase Eis [Streptomyces fumanus]